MKNLQKMGGLAALYSGIIYVLGILGYMLVLDYGNVVDPVQKVALLADNQAFMYMLTLCVYVLFGPFLVVLALALYDRLKANSPAIMQIATVIGIIWAAVVLASGMIFNIGMARVVALYGTDPSQAATVWMAIDAVFEGIGGGTELLGGIWVLMVSWSSLRAGEFPKALNYLGVVIGVVGILSTVPGLMMLTDVFGLTQIVWFIWLGIVMLRSKSGAAV
jgi:hypothetical protein